jgi:DNA-binding NarL/FixJ family response regulator
VVVVSSIGTPAAIEELKSRGVRGFLRKPLRPENLRQVVNTVMGGINERRS